jgi:NodT family efflux transporter outer membrane factor (OMF) lipoprotein
MTRSKWEKWLLAVALLAQMSACTLGPDYVRPAVDAPPDYKEMDGWKAASLREEQAGPIDEAWWRLYGDPLLDEMEAQAIAANPDIAIAEAQFRQARALAQSARAGLFPELRAGASIQRSTASENAGKATGGEAVSDFLLPIDLSWELDLWGRIRRSVEAGAASAQASAADLAGVRLSIQAELAQDYLQLRILDAQKRLLDATVARYAQALTLTTNRYNSGVASRADVLQAQTQLQAASTQAIEAALQRSQLEHAMAILIGKSPAEFAVPVTETLPDIPEIPVAVPSELLEKRPDIAAAERRMASANAKIGMAEAAFYPTLQLGASAGFEASHIDQWLSWPSRFWAVGPSVSQLVFDGGLRKAQREQALAAYDATVASYRKTVLGAFQEVEDKLAAIRRLEEEARMQSASVQAAREAAKLVLNQYRAGTVGYTSVIVAQTAELAAEKALLDIQSRRLAARVLLIKALGGGWQMQKMSR